MASAARALITLAIGWTRTAVQAIGSLIGLALSTLSFVWNNALYLVAAISIILVGIAWVNTHQVALSNVEHGFRCAGQAYRDNVRPILVALVDYVNTILCYINAWLWFVRRLFLTVFRELLADCGGFTQLLGPIRRLFTAIVGDVLLGQFVLPPFSALEQGLNLTSTQEATIELACILENVTACACEDFAPLTRIVFLPLKLNSTWCAAEATTRALVALYKPIVNILYVELETPTLKPPRPVFDEFRREACQAIACAVDTAAQVVQDVSDVFLGFFDTVKVADLFCILTTGGCIVVDLVTTALDTVFSLDLLYGWPTGSDWLSTKFRPNVVRLLNLIAEPTGTQNPAALGFGATLNTTTFLVPVGSPYDVETKIPLSSLPIDKRLDACLCDVIRFFQGAAGLTFIDLCPILNVLGFVVDVLLFFLDIFINIFQPQKWAHYWDLRWIERSFSSEGWTAIIPELFFAVPPLQVTLQALLDAMGIFLRSVVELVRILILKDDTFGYIQKVPGFGPEPLIQCSYFDPTVCNLYGASALFWSRISTFTINLCASLQALTGLSLAQWCCVVERTPKPFASGNALLLDVAHAVAFGDPDGYLGGPGDALQTAIGQVTADTWDLAGCFCAMFKFLIDFLGVDDPVTGLNPCECTFAAMRDQWRFIYELGASAAVNLGRDADFLGGYFAEKATQPGIPSSRPRTLFSFTTMAGALIKGDYELIVENYVRVTTCVYRYIEVLPFFTRGLNDFVDDSLAGFIIALFRIPLRAFVRAAQGDDRYFTEFSDPTRIAVVRSNFWRTTSPFMADLVALMDSIVGPPVPLSMNIGPGGPTPVDPFNFDPLTDDETIGESYPFTSTGTTIDNNRLTQIIVEATPGRPGERPSLMSATIRVGDAFLPGDWAFKLLCPVARGLRLVISVVILLVETGIRATLGIFSAGGFRVAFINWLATTPTPLSRANLGFPLAVTKAAPAEEPWIMLSLFAKCFCEILGFFRDNPLACLCGHASATSDSVLGSPRVGILTEVFLALAQLGLTAVQLMRDALTFQISLTKNMVVPLTLMVGRLFAATMCLFKEFVKLLPIYSADQEITIDLAVDQLALDLARVVFAIPRLVSSTLDGLFGSNVVIDPETYDGGQNLVTTQGATGFFARPGGSYVEDGQLYSYSCTQDRPSCKPALLGANPPSNESSLLSIVLGFVRPIFDLLVSAAEVWEALLAPIGFMQKGASFIATIMRIFRSVGLTLVSLVVRVFLLIIDLVTQIRSTGLFRFAPTTIRIRIIFFTISFKLPIGISFPILDFAIDLFKVIISAAKGLAADEHTYKQMETTNGVPLNIINKYDDAGFKRRRGPVEEDPLHIEVTLPEKVPLSAWWSAAKTAHNAPNALAMTLRRTQDRVNVTNCMDSPKLGPLTQERLAQCVQHALNVSLPEGATEEEILDLARGHFEGANGRGEYSSTCGVIMEYTRTLIGASIGTQARWTSCLVRASAGVATRSLVGPTFPSDFYQKSGGTPWLKWWHNIAQRSWDKARNATTDESSPPEDGPHSAAPSHTRRRDNSDPSSRETTNGDGLSLLSVGLEHLGPAAWTDMGLQPPQRLRLPNGTIYQQRVIPHPDEGDSDTGNIPTTIKEVTITTDATDHEPLEGEKRTAKEYHRQEAHDKETITDNDVNHAVVSVLGKMLDEGEFDDETTEWLRGRAECPPGLEARPWGRMLTSLTRTLTPSLNWGDADAFGMGDAWLWGGDPKGGPIPTASRHRRASSPPPPLHGHAQVYFSPGQPFGRRQSSILRDVVSHREWKSSARGPLTREASRARRRWQRALTSYDPDTLSGYVPPLLGEAPITYIPGMPHPRLARGPKPTPTAAQARREYHQVTRERLVHVADTMKELNVVGPNSKVHPEFQPELLRFAQSIDFILYNLVSGRASALLWDDESVNNHPTPNNKGRKRGQGEASAAGTEDAAAGAYKQGLGLGLLWTLTHHARAALSSDLALLQDHIYVRGGRYVPDMGQSMSTLWDATGVAARAAGRVGRAVSRAAAAVEYPWRPWTWKPIQWTQAMGEALSRAKRDTGEALVGLMERVLRSRQGAKNPEYGTNNSPTSSRGMEEPEEPVNQPIDESVYPKSLGSFFYGQAKARFPEPARGKKLGPGARLWNGIYDGFLAVEPGSPQARLREQMWEDARRHSPFWAWHRGDLDEWIKVHDAPGRTLNDTIHEARKRAASPNVNDKGPESCPMGNKRGGGDGSCSGDGGVAGTLPRTSRWNVAPHLGGPALDVGGYPKRGGWSPGPRVIVERARASVQAKRMVIKASRLLWPNHPGAPHHRLVRDLTPRRATATGEEMDDGLADQRFVLWSMMRQDQGWGASSEPMPRRSVMQVMEAECDGSLACRHMHTERFVVGPSCKAVDKIYGFVDQYLTYCRDLVIPRPADPPTKKRHHPNPRWTLKEVSLDHAARGHTDFDLLGPIRPLLRPGAIAIWGIQAVDPHAVARRRQAQKHVSREIPGDLLTGGKGRRGLTPRAASFFDNPEYNDYTPTLLVVPRWLCERLDALVGTQTVGALDDLFASAGEFFDNPNLDESLGPLGLRGWLNFLTTCPAVRGISCEFGVGLKQALYDTLIWFLLVGFVIRAMLPGGLSDLVMLVAFIVMGLVFVIHAWRLPPLCIPFQVPICLPNEVVDLADTLLRPCYDVIIPQCLLLNTTADPCVPCGVYNTYVDCRDVGLGNAPAVALATLDRWLPGTCGVIDGILGTGPLLDWLFPALPTFVRRTCGLVSTSTARDLARRDTCLTLMTPLGASAVVYVLLAAWALGIVGGVASIVGSSALQAGNEAIDAGSGAMSGFLDVTDEAAYLDGEPIGDFIE